MTKYQLFDDLIRQVEVLDLTCVKKGKSRPKQLVMKYRKWSYFIRMNWKYNT